MTPPISRPVLHTVSAASSTNVSTLMSTVTEETKVIEEGNGEMVRPGRKMVQLGRKMVQLGKKMCNRGRMRRATLDPVLLRDRGEKRGAALVSMLLGDRGGVCTALDPVLLGYRGEKDSQPSTQCSWGTREENARPLTQCSRGTGEENPVLLRDQGEKRCATLDWLIQVLIGDRAGDKD